MTTNTHIAAQARLLANSLQHVLTTHGMPLTAVAAQLLECAQALEAAPALDAQGEARNAIHLELLRDLISNDAYALSFQTMGQYRTAILKAFAAKPPPPAVGKPLSEQQLLEIAKDPQQAPCNPWWLKDEVVLNDIRAAAISFARAIERAHGIVTKETGT